MRDFRGALTGGGDYTDSVGGSATPASNVLVITYYIASTARGSCASSSVTSCEATAGVMALWRCAKYWFTAPCIGAGCSRPRRSNSRILRSFRAMYAKSTRSLGEGDKHRIDSRA